MDCSFCGASKSRWTVRSKHAPNVVICDDCVGLCVDILAEDVDVPSGPPEDTWLQQRFRDRAATVLMKAAALVPPKDLSESPFRCSYCNRARTEVPKLVSGPRVFICSLCIAGAVAEVTTNIAVELDCSFCAKPQREVKWLVQANDQHAICDECIGLGIEIIGGELGMTDSAPIYPPPFEDQEYRDFVRGVVAAAAKLPLPTTRVDNALHCTFCNRSRNDVAKMIAGPSVYICNTCVGRTAEAMIEAARER